MKKGFTLIELLAVIIILAVIALIATPMVLNVVDDARLKAAESSVNGYVNAIENARYEYLFKNNMAEPTDDPEGTENGKTAFEKLGTITTKGETVSCEGVTLTKGVVAATKCSTMDGDTAKYTCAVVNGLATKCAKGAAVASE